MAGSRVGVALVGRGLRAQCALVARVGRARRVDREEVGDDTRPQHPSGANSMSRTKRSVLSAGPEMCKLCGPKPPPQRNLKTCKLDSKSTQKRFRIMFVFKWFLHILGSLCLPTFPYGLILSKDVLDIRQSQGLYGVIWRG